MIPARSIPKINWMIPPNTTAKRKFSKLHLINTYLRTTIKQKRLNHYMILGIYPELVDSLNTAKIVKILSFFSMFSRISEDLYIPYLCFPCFVFFSWMKNIALLIINQDQNEFEKHTLPIIGLNILHINKEIRDKF